MQAQCPCCGAIIHFSDSNVGQPSRVTCWMCNSTVEKEPGSAPLTIVAPSSNRRERVGAIGLRGGPAAETASLDLEPGDLVTICVASGRSVGKDFQLGKPLTTIGRLGGGADIEIDDPEVSRSHCAVEVRRDAILLHDLRSTNGTYLGNDRVSVARLEPMSYFRIGSSFLQLRVPKLQGSSSPQQLVS
jgi:Inner membrane component of T3SS, cytoplasmic domain